MYITRIFDTGMNIFTWSNQLNGYSVSCSSSKVGWKVLSEGNKSKSIINQGFNHDHGYSQCQGQGFRALPRLKMGFINPSFPLNGYPYLVTLHNILNVANLQSAHRQFLPIHLKLDEKLTEIGRLFKLVYSIWTTSQFTSQDCQDNLFVLQITLTII